MTSLGFCLPLGLGRGLHVRSLSKRLLSIKLWTSIELFGLITVSNLLKKRGSENHVDTSKHNLANACDTTTDQT